MFSEPPFIYCEENIGTDRELLYVYSHKNDALDRTFYTNSGVPYNINDVETDCLYPLEVYNPEFTATTSPYTIDLGSTLMLGGLLAFFIAYWIVGLSRSRKWN